MKHITALQVLFAALLVAFQGETLAHPVFYALQMRTTPDTLPAARPYPILPRFQLEPKSSTDGSAQYTVSLRSLLLDEARRRQENGEEESKRFKPEDFFLHPPPHRHGRRHVQ
ncbi:hypothetical protein BCV69DRAFT_281720 [Microstroma glucosiphilum]|uniref:Uncharacterized protein n=1 Tax=Pseudomicrostroma glucosiphilum TaxID=1684307 RepID=A0A316UAE4_9BASI|nr:hypothetical protein BCV69DRAFT_281720 [Pseudomicrostroma glucosiphilum]PWN21794.1 hypothetical protein BCV69DRAFT_281720 [Pseudomicrostroma glucosiphilum]